MAWYYAYCHFGPGHQSHDEGFFEVDDKLNKDQVEEQLMRRWEDRDWPIMYCWKVPYPPKNTIQQEIDDLRSVIKRAQAELKHLQTIKMFDNGVFQEPGRDELIVERLTGTISYSVVEQLHNIGLFVKVRDVTDWQWGIRKPIANWRRKVLNAIKRAERFSSPEPLVK
jgi:hypothetical protein